jgi:hypothetical protein
MEREITLLLPRHGYNDVAGEETLVRIDEFAARFRNLAITAGVYVNDLHGTEGTARVCSVSGCFEGGFRDGDYALLLGLGGTGRVRKIVGGGVGEMSCRSLNGWIGFGWLRGLPGRRDCRQ